MEIFHYSPLTSEILGVGLADPDPLDEDNWLIPAYATSIAPEIEPQENETLIFVSDHWEAVPDYREVTYWLADGSSHKIESLGEVPPEDALLEDPLANPPALTLDERKVLAKAKVDEYAGYARKRFVDSCSLIADEYLLVKSTTEEWVANGAVESEIPATVKVWADAKGLSYTVAADEILAQARKWEQILTTIRSIRVVAKIKVDEVTDESVDLMDFIQPYLDQLEALKPDED